MHKAGSSSGFGQVLMLAVVHEHLLQAMMQACSQVPCSLIPLFFLFFFFFALLHCGLDLERSRTLFQVDTLALNKWCIGCQVLTYFVQTGSNKISELPVEFPSPPSLLFI